MTNPVSRRTIVAGNWKHGPLRDEGLGLARDVARGAELRGRSDLEIVLFPPAPYWGAIAEGATDGSAYRLGAQDVDVVDLGAYTGAIGGELAKSFGVTAVLVGHSERRREFGDDDDACRKKLDAVVGHGLEPFLCVGETLEERERDETLAVVERQLDVALKGFAGDSPLVVAYEPVWAIGTGLTATPDQAADVHVRIRAWLGSRFGSEVGNTIPVLYGGSVKPTNAGELLAADEIDGALVGGASLKSDSFLGIVDAIPGERGGQDD